MGCWLLISEQSELFETRVGPKLPRECPVALTSGWKTLIRHGSPRPAVPEERVEDFCLTAIRSDSLSCARPAWAPMLTRWKTLALAATPQRRESEDRPPSAFRFCV